MRQDEVADALREVRAVLAAATGQSDAACGLPFAGQAHDDMRTSWLRELDVYAASLEQESR
ncbi:hypothetical protein [Actinokineospora sp. NBRC 105648]|uniref:hypothetical protein n=1 Tax=Actinokineospora sp. NBRC 105648 TaxID=3032206 RepID=UPI0024A45742|nr:hypothetical protein [Actinokineospora sp. NBRC 105648]GLZ37723.1 hypothetical protein Acsp05_13480 [Actinokineospora sp. NBRC 105648]